MMRIGKQVNFRTMAGEQGFLARVSNPKHVAIIISYSGETDEIIRIAKTLKKQKTKIIAITSLWDNQLSHYSDLILHISSKEKIFNKMAPFSSLLSIQYICTMLYACFFSLNYNEHKAFKLHYDYEEDLRHPFYSPINEK
jgi:DNA-binding MurR/RpiR family transcriptional regulator